MHSRTDLTVQFSVNVKLVLCCGAVAPWNDDSILIILKFEGEGVLLGVLSGRNAGASLRLLNVLHELKVHI